MIAGIAAKVQDQCARSSFSASASDRNNVASLILHANIAEVTAQE